jgi:TatD DNase family protein
LTIEIIDTHAHLDMPEFDQDREEVINKAREKGVSTIVTIGINMESNRRAVKLAEQYPFVLAGIGIHPQDSRGIQHDDIAALSELASHPRVVAIGETGLDFFRDHAPHEDQIQALLWQLEVAQKTGLPVIIHCRQAQETILPILEKWAGSFKPAQGKPRGVLHCANVDTRTAEKYIEMGFYFSLGAYIGYPSSRALRETIRVLPLETIMFETDCPFLPPQKLRGKRNEPSYTLATLEVLSEIKQISPEEIAGQTTLNAKRFISKVPDASNPPQDKN